MDGLTQTLRTLGPGRLLVMGIVGAGMMGFFLFLASRLASPGLVLLYSDLEMSDSGQIVGQLETMGVPYRLAGNGAQIMVPSDQVLRLRVALAEQGLPAGGSVGFEVFDDAGGLGTTSFVQNINLIRALEGELARTISAFDQIRSARVHVVLPRRELFQSEPDKPSASVFIRQRGGARLGPRKIAAIQHLVGSALPGLLPERVAVIDGRGNLLASGNEDPDAIGAVASRADEFRLNFEMRLKHNIRTLLEPSVGAGNVRVEVNAEINFDRTTINEEIYNPDGQVVRSSQSVEDISNSTEAKKNVSVGNNLPEGTEQESGGESANSSARTEETVNYEISKTIRSHIRESGTVKRLSVAVLVDGTYEIDPEEETRTYIPRGQQELDQLTTLVRSTMGYDEARGDTLEVVNMQFAPLEAPDEYIEPFLGLSKSDYMRIIEILVLTVVAVLVILLVLRPLVSRLFAAVPAMVASAQAAAALEGPAGQAMLIGPDGAPAPGAVTDAAAALPEVEAVSEVESMIDLNKVAGQVKASSLKKLGEIVDQHPDEALNILRGWMGENTL